METTANSQQREEGPNVLLYSLVGRRYFKNNYGHIKQYTHLRILTSLMVHSAIMGILVIVKGNRTLQPSRRSDVFFTIFLLSVVLLRLNMTTEPVGVGSKTKGITSPCPLRSHRCLSMTPNHLLACSSCSPSLESPRCSPGPFGPPQNLCLSVQFVVGAFFGFAILFKGQGASPEVLLRWNK